MTAEGNDPNFCAFMAEDGDLIDDGEEWEGIQRRWRHQRYHGRGARRVPKRHLR